MELRHLRYFVGVAQEGGFTRAAARLRVAQPALSRQIRQLEDDLGVALLDRTHTGVRLTAAGEAFLCEALAILDRSESAVRAARAGTAVGQASLNLGYVWGLFHSTAPALIARFRRSHPDVSVHLLDLTATQQAEALAEGRIDAGLIGFREEADAARLSTRIVGRCTFVAALPASHRAARRRRIDLAMLAQDSFLVISDRHYPGAAKWVMDACAAAGFRPRTLQTPERGHTILGLVAGNCGVAVLPEPLRALPHAGVVFRPLTGAPSIDLHLAWNPSRLNPVRDAFLEEIR